MLLRVVARWKGRETQAVHVIGFISQRLVLEHHAATNVSLIFCTLALTAKKSTPPNYHHQQQTEIAYCLHTGSRSRWGQHHCREWAGRDNRGVGQLATLCQVTGTLLTAGWTRHATSGGSTHPHAASVSVTGASKASALHAATAAEATTRTSSATTRSATSTWPAITATRLLLLYIQTMLPIELDWLKHAQTSVNSCSSTPSSSPHLNRSWVKIVNSWNTEGRGPGAAWG